MNSLQQRLAAILHDGNLTIADLARWFGRPHPTVSGWVRGGQVGGAQLDTAYIWAQVLVLERRIRKRQGFPVPRLSRADRARYLEKLRAR